MKFEDISTLLTPEELPYLSGVERLDNGIVHVAVLTRMPGVSPEMIRWWLGDYMRTTEHYRRWHPRDHVWMSWDYKQPGTHVGARHLVHEYIGSRLHKLRITFVPPAEFFSDAMTRRPEALALCGRAGPLNQPIDLGRLVHLAIPRPWGCELHSRFWLGHVASRNGARWPATIGNAPSVRRVFARTSFGHALAVHCHEEMSTLAGFLPDLYASESQGP